MRRAASLSIKREHVDLENGLIAVEAASQKNRRGKRYLVGPDAVEAIGKIWLPERELTVRGRESADAVRRLRRPDRGGRCAVPSA